MKQIPSLTFAGAHLAHHPEGSADTCRRFRNAADLTSAGHIDSSTATGGPKTHEHMACWSFRPLHEFISRNIRPPSLRRNNGDAFIALLAYVYTFRYILMLETLILHRNGLR
jgi:hypothetical protein